MLYPNRSAIPDEEFHKWSLYRLDHLKQHVHQVHCRNARRNQIFDLQDWSYELPRDTYNLTCGFCGFRNKTWNDRATHISQHFEEGLDMSAWRTSFPQAPSDDSAGSED